jgi:hypothetical protein
MVVYPVMETNGKNDLEQTNITITADQNNRNNVPSRFLRTDVFVFKLFT